MGSCNDSTNTCFYITGCHGVPPKESQLLNNGCLSLQQGRQHHKQVNRLECSFQRELDKKKKDVT